jgi:hypothetical protein
LKSVDNNLKTKPKHFWQYVASLRKKIISLQLEVECTLLVEPSEVADAFVKHFRLVYNTSFPGVLPTPTTFSECRDLPLFPSWKFVTPLDV